MSEPTSVELSRAFTAFEQIHKELREHSPEMQTRILACLAIMRGIDGAVVDKLDAAWRVVISTSKP